MEGSTYIAGGQLQDIGWCYLWWKTLLGVKQHGETMGCTSFLSFFWGGEGQTLGKNLLGSFWLNLCSFMMKGWRTWFTQFTIFYNNIIRFPSFLYTKEEKKHQYQHQPAAKLLNLDIGIGPEFHNFCISTCVHTEGSHTGTHQTGLSAGTESSVAFKSHESPVANRLQPRLMSPDHQDKCLW